MEEISNQSDNPPPMDLFFTKRSVPSSCQIEAVKRFGFASVSLASGPLAENQVVPLPHPNYFRHPFR